MSFRDDREALHHRVAQLEQELDDARREGIEQGKSDASARAAELEKNLSTMTEELARMRRELALLKGERTGDSTPNKGRLTVAFVAFGTVLTAAMWMFLGRGSPKPPPDVVSPASPRATPTEAEPAHVTPRPPAPPPKKPDDVPARKTTATWTAKVTKADGLALAPKSTCVVEADLQTRGLTNIIVPRLTVMCGAQKLFSSEDPLSGMAQRDNDAREELGATDDKSTFTISYRDIGTRTGERAQIDLDSRHGQAVAFRDTIPRYRVELTIATKSAPTQPIADANRRLKRTGKVVSVSGLKVKAEASCSLRAMPNGSQASCVADLTCGGTQLFSPTVAIFCKYDEAGKPTSVSFGGLFEQEGDVLTLKAPQGTATIALDP